MEVVDWFGSPFVECFECGLSARACSSASNVPSGRSRRTTRRSREVPSGTVGGRIAMLKSPSASRICWRSRAAWSEPMTRGDRSDSPPGHRFGPSSSRSPTDPRSRRAFEHCDPPSHRSRRHLPTAPGGASAPPRWDIGRTAACPRGQSTLKAFDERATEPINNFHLD
jgi:hypothetical protein